MRTDRLMPGNTTRSRTAWGARVAVTLVAAGAALAGPLAGASQASSWYGTCSQVVLTATQNVWRCSGVSDDTSANALYAARLTQARATNMPRICFEDAYSASAYRDVYGYWRATLGYNC